MIPRVMAVAPRLGDRWSSGVPKGLGICSNRSGAGGGGGGDSRFTDAEQILRK